MRFKSSGWIAFVLLFAVAMTSGCGVNFYFGRPTDLKKIEQLSTEMDRLKRQKDAEAHQLEDTESLMRQRLQKELADKQVTLEMAEKGLVLTFLAEVLFDSGKSKVRAEAEPTLEKIASVIHEKAGDREVGIEGHTDNEPIKHSGWKSNWELSTGRATSVLHALEDHGVESRLLVATGYGEYHPVVGNDSVEGRQKNRRVEIVILPKKFTRSEKDLLRRAESSSDPDLARKARAMESYK